MSAGIKGREKEERAMQLLWHGLEREGKYVPLSSLWCIILCVIDTSVY